MKKVDNSQFVIDDFNRGASSFKIGLWYLVNTLFFLNPLNPFSSLKSLLLRAFGAKIGKGVMLKPMINIKFPWKLSVGDYSWIGENVWIDNLDYVVISSSVTISQGAMLLTGNHNYKKTTFNLFTGKIIIEDGVWIGAKAIVCPGVKCNSHSVLLTGGIATDDMDSYGIYQGNPAVFIRKRNIE